ncbi:MAG: TRAP transporter small permease subunit [Synergistetes bacterium]|nr:TRAP transporter small permease subunit [Synergistota bacterium]MCX8127697.1 TRAP transporter small permease subunit [Synergistota bacterium]MDW8191388.1 TRAP transporter small permease subunit [Synergistota bacterium]
MRSILKFIDLVNEKIGMQVGWLAAVLVLIGVIGVIRRYLLHQSTAWEYELIIMSGAAMYVLSWGYVLLRNAHTRVDILYARLSPRGRALIDAIGSIFLFFPLIGTMVTSSYSWMVFSISIKETSATTYVYPPLYPLRTIIFIGFLLFFLQGVAFFIRNVYYAIKGESL